MYGRKSTGQILKPMFFPASAVVCFAGFVVVVESIGFPNTGEASVLLFIKRVKEKFKW